MHGHAIQNPYSRILIAYSLAYVFLIGAVYKKSPRVFPEKGCSLFFVIRSRHRTIIVSEILSLDRRPFLALYARRFCKIARTYLKVIVDLSRIYRDICGPVCISEISARITAEVLLCSRSALTSVGSREHTVGEANVTGAGWVGGEGGGARRWK